MALVDANYQFVYVDVGAEGRLADGGVWKACSLKKKIDKKQVKLPPPVKLHDSDVVLPYVIVADDAFAMTENLMKPFARRRRLTHEERIFNYRLSRARRCSENAFGIMAMRFRLFLTDIHTSPDNATDIVLATCCLHNYLRRNCGTSYIPAGSVDYEDVNQHLVDGEWRRYGDIYHLQATQHRNANAKSKYIREVLAEYFASVAGALPWQDDMI